MGSKLERSDQPPLEFRERATKFASAAYGLINSKYRRKVHLYIEDLIKGKIDSLRRSADDVFETDEFTGDEAAEIAESFRDRASEFYLNSQEYRDLACWITSTEENLVVKARKDLKKLASRHEYRGELQSEIDVYPAFSQRIDRESSRERLRPHEIIYGSHLTFRFQ